MLQNIFFYTARCYENCKLTSLCSSDTVRKSLNNKNFIHNTKVGLLFLTLCLLQNSTNHIATNHIINRKFLLHVHGRVCIRYIGLLNGPQDDIKFKRNKRKIRAPTKFLKWCFVVLDFFLLFGGKALLLILLILLRLFLPFNYVIELTHLASRIASIHVLQSDSVAALSSY